MLDKRKTLDEKLDMLIISKKGLEPSHFWIGIAINLIIILGTISFNYGTLDTKVKNIENRVDEHIKTRIEHVTRDLYSEIKANTTFIAEHKNNTTGIIERVSSLEKNQK